jgi:hypothetical protein
LVPFIFLNTEEAEEAESSKYVALISLLPLLPPVHFLLIAPKDRTRFFSSQDKCDGHLEVKITCADRQILLDRILLRLLRFLL